MKAATITARLYFETLRHLKAEQIIGRARHRFSQPRPNAAPPPPVRPHSVFTVPARRRPSMLAADRFTFLNVARSLKDGGWDAASLPKLWRYNLHYFDDLNAHESGARAAWHQKAISRWIAENPPGQGTGWEPYPTSLRLVNWIKYHWRGHLLPPATMASLAVQARWLEQRLEFHLLGNHLFANAKALVFAGAFFAGAEAERWLQRGLTILAREVREQILPDGGHFERSPLYHALALEDLLDLINLAQTQPILFAGSLGAVVDGWRVVAARMEAALAALCHPDGEIAFFNDAAFDIAPTPEELFAYGERLGLGRPDVPAGAGALPDSGYVRLADETAVALLDVAPVGPDYLPGHAHADTLSFELSVGGARVLVNSGTSTYETGAERQRQRGTAAHNTVVVDGADSSEVWAAFRVARRARPFGLAVFETDAVTDVTCAHDGYRRLPGQPVHRRTWSFRPGALTVSDSVEGPHETAVAAFHLHPDWTLTLAEGERSGVLAHPGGTKVRWSVLAGTVQAAPSSWHPRFGESLPSQCLLVTLADGVGTVSFHWDVPGGGA